MHQIPLPTRNNPLVSLGPCPEILLVDRVLRFPRPYPKMAMIANGKPVIYVFRSQEHPKDADSELSKRVVRKYERFNNRKVQSVDYAELELSGWKRLGKCIGEVYCSDKEGYGNEQQYLHEHNEPYPTIYMNKYGDVYVIIGGSFKVEEWIEG